jgi:bifunctional enzyme CysN/CysC
VSASTQDFHLCFVGHVDHGKSTLIGRLLADTNSLPDGKLEQIKKFCEKNSRPFEYAFLLDALKEEQRQGITIDTSRVFLQSEKRRYQIIDAPGHFQFLKNMVSGASRAHAAFLVVDAQDGFQENSKRHAGIVHFLGVPHLAVLVNKMDLVGYSQDRFDELRKAISAYLEKWNLRDITFIPVSGFLGEQITRASTAMPWYKGPTLLNYLDSLPAPLSREGETRFWVQDIYKFTENGDQRRIVAGVLKSGSLTENQELRIVPGEMKATVEKVEGLASGSSPSTGDCLGILLKEDLYLSRGQVLTAAKSELPVVNSARTQMIWLKSTPLPLGHRCWVKVGTQKTEALLSKIDKITDSSSLEVRSARLIEKSELAEVIWTFKEPLAVSFDFDDELSRFVIVDDHQISGGGRFLEKAAEPWQTKAPFQVEASRAQASRPLFVWSARSEDVRNLYQALAKSSSTNVVFLQLNEVDGLDFTELRALLSQTASLILIDVSRLHPREALRLSREWPGSLSVALGADDQRSHGFSEQISSDWMTASSSDVASGLLQKILHLP